MESAAVTIVVLNWNRPHETIACLESLQRAELGGARVTVVDNGSRDGSVDIIRSRFPDVEIIALPENRGYAGGNNAGIRAALDRGAEGVLLLNNDAVVAPDFLGSLVWVFGADPGAAAASSATMRLDVPELLQIAYLDLYFGHGLVMRRGVYALPGDGFDRVREVDVAVGCSLLLSGATLRTIGLFDESYFAYHEEVDWCFRARQAGFRVYYQPFSRVYHHGSKSTQDLNETSRPGQRAGKPQLPNATPLPWNPIRNYLGARNAVRFLRKHASREQIRRFARSTLYLLPLEMLAVIMDREEDIDLAVWTYQRAAAVYFLERHGLAWPGPSDRSRQLRVALRSLRWMPLDLLWCLPRDTWHAYRGGHLAQVIQYARGLWDGILDRPLPLERLGLR